MTNTAYLSSIWLARHGESAGNVARDSAEADGRELIDIATRDMDVVLSRRGEEQARALGKRLSTSGVAYPDAIFCSPYVRAEQTARIAAETAGIANVQIVIDERLREREFGMLDRLTKLGIMNRYPEQAEARAYLGKFYHRPPGGESWCDVALRVRSLLRTLSGAYAGGRVLIVSHQVVILMTRYVLEHLNEDEILAVDRLADVANCSLTIYDTADSGELRLQTFNDVSHLQAVGVAITREGENPDGT